MQIVNVDPRTDELWFDLIMKYNTTVFHSPAWINAVMTTYEWQPEAYVLLDDNNHPVAGLPFCRIDDIRGQRLVCFPFSDATDPLADTPEKWDLLLKKLQEFDTTIIVRCLHNDIPLNTTRDKALKQAAWHGMDLSRSLDDIWASIAGSARRAIRKAEKSGVVIEIDNSEAAMRAFFDMHLNIRKHKYRLLAQPYALFYNIWKELINKGYGCILVAKVDGEVVAANMYLEWKNTLTYKFSASNAAYQNYRPTDALIWRAIKYGKERNYTFLDFGLSDLDQDGLIGYKRKFATDEKKISFIRYEPDSINSTAAQRQASMMLPKLTQLFTETDVPDDVTERAGNLLYRFFV